MAVLFSIRKRLDSLSKKIQVSEEQRLHKKAVEEMSEWYEAVCQEYNSPMAEKLRKREYQELLANGEIFRQKCHEKE